MNFTEYALSGLRQNLEAIAQGQDAARIRGLLEGAGLPALGGGEEPAEWLLQALDGADHFLRLSVSRLAAQLLGDIVNGKGRNEVDWADGGYNLLLLASHLPRDIGLFDALHRLHQSAPGLPIQCARQLRRALANQQADGRLREHWLELLGETKATWDGERRTELLEAWRGLMLIPPSAEQHVPLDWESLDLGLRAFCCTVEEKPQAVSLLRHALRLLENTVPLDPRTWVEMLRPFWQQWPELLRDVAAELWPGLEIHEPESPPLTPELRPLWDALDDSSRGQLQAYWEKGDARAGRNVLQELYFNPPNLAGCPVQEVRTLLHELEKRLWPVHGKHPDVFQQFAVDDWKDAGKVRREKRIDRLAARDSANRGLEGVEKSLRRGNLEQARQYLEEIVRQQERQGVDDAHIHIAKTLSKAAVLAQNAGFVAWAEELLRRAYDCNSNDEVPANGLAEVLKAQGRLDEAETQYRANIKRWPNDEVAACGLAEVLKAQGRLEEAEAQYRANTIRWPNDEVSANGLAEVFKTQGRLDEAETQYRANIKRFPNNEVAANGLAELLKAQGRLVEAEAQYCANRKRWPNNDAAACGLADVLKAQGRLKEAEAEYRANITSWPNKVFSACGLAEVLKAQGRLDEAEVQYRANTTRWPNDEVSACGLAEVLKAQGRLDEAETQYRANTTRWPNNVFSACGLAEVLKAQGRLIDAETQYRSNVTRWPANEVAACGLADVLKAQGRLVDAEAQYRANMKHWPTDRVAINGLANVLRKQNRHGEALQLLPQPVSSSDPFDLHLRGMILLELNRLKEAVAAFTLGMKQSVNSQTREFFRRGLLLAELRERDYAAALRRLKDISEDLPSLDVYKLHIASGQGEASWARNLYESLTGQGEAINFFARETISLIGTGFHLAEGGELRQPNDEEHLAIIRAEIDMELAA